MYGVSSQALFGETGLSVSSSAYQPWPYWTNWTSNLWRLFLQTSLDGKILAMLLSSNSDMDHFEILAEQVAEQTELLR